jgi:MbtH protein
MKKHKGWWPRKRLQVERVAYADDQEVVHKQRSPKAENRELHRREMMEEIEDKTIYKVVMNHEEEYSIWPADREIPLGWRDAGKSGPKAECLAYIKEVWTDMRPLSLRKEMDKGVRKT